MSHASAPPTMIVPIALHSGRVAGVDVLRDARVSVALQVCAIGAFAGLTVLGAQVRIYLWDIPITLQTVFVYGSGLFLGSRNGFVLDAPVPYAWIGVAGLCGGWVWSLLPLQQRQCRLSFRHAILCCSDWDALLPLEFCFRQHACDRRRLLLPLCIRSRLVSFRGWPCTPGFESIDKGWFRFAPV